MASRAPQNWSKNTKPPFASLSKANPSRKSKSFFLNRTKKPCRIRRGFGQLSSYSGWRVFTKKPRANLLARAVVIPVQAWSTTKEVNFRWRSAAPSQTIAHEGCSSSRYKAENVLSVEHPEELPASKSREGLSISRTRRCLSK